MTETAHINQHVPITTADERAMVALAFMMAHWPDMTRAELQPILLAMIFWSELDNGRELEDWLRDDGKD